MDMNHQVSFMDRIIDHTTPMALALLIVILLAIILLIALQLKKDVYDLRHLILDTATNQPSIYKMGQLAALLVSTWGFVDLTMNNRLTEFYFTSYMAIWAGINVTNNVAMKWAESKIGKVATPEELAKESGIKE